MLNRKNWGLWGLSIVMVLLTLTVWAEQTQAQGKYPNRPITIINPFSPGGTGDIMGRLLAAHVSKKWGVAVNVVSKPGGNTIPALLDVYSAPSDGYTLLLDAINCTTLLQVAVKDLPFQIMDRSFIAMLCESPYVVFVPSTSPFKSMDDLSADARNKPENFTWTSLGGSGAADLVARRFLKSIGVDVYKTKPAVAGGGAQSVVLVAGGHVKMGVASKTAALPVYGTGNIKILGITGKERDPSFSNVPTTTEAGYPKVQGPIWNSLSGPPKLPSAIVEMWDKAMQEMLKDPDIIAKMKNVGLFPFYKNAQETKETIRQEIQEVKELWGLK